MSNILLAQVYNCSDSTNSAYGASDYGTCETGATGGSTNPGTQTTVGAPNTGFFQQIVSGGTFSILLPVAIAIILVIISTFIVRKKRITNQSR